MSTEGPSEPSAVGERAGEEAASARPRESVPSDRYGKSREDRRIPRGWRTWLVLASVVLVGGAVAFIAERNLGSAPIEATRTSFRQLPGNALALTIEVSRDEPRRAGVCVVKVRSISGAETGRREVLVPASQSTVTTTIKSTEPPVTASVVGCSYNVPPYMSSPQRPME